MPLSGLIGQSNTPRWPSHSPEYQHSKLRLLWYLHSIDLSGDAASFTQSARPGKVLISFTKIFEGWRLLWRGEMRDGNELRYIPLFHIAHVNFLPLQSTIFWPCKLCIVIQYSLLFYSSPSVLSCCFLLVDVKVTVVEFVCVSVGMWGQTRLLWLELLPAQSSLHIWDRIR